MSKRWLWILLLPGVLGCAAGPAEKETTPVETPAVKWVVSCDSDPVTRKKTCRTVYNKPARDVVARVEVEITHRGEIIIYAGEARHETLLWIDNHMPVSMPTGLFQGPVATALVRQMLNGQYGVVEYGVYKRFSFRLEGFAESYEKLVAEMGFDPMEGSGF